MSTITTLTMTEPPRLSSSGSSTRSKLSVSSQCVAPVVAQQKGISSTGVPPPKGIPGLPSAMIRAREHHDLEGIELQDIRARRVGAQDPKGQPSSDPEFPMSVRDEKIFLATLCFNLALAGWNDGTLGPLLTRIQEYYHIGYTAVSLIFVVGCVGNMTGAVSNVYLFHKLGFGKTMALASVVQLIAYAIMAIAPPYPVFCVALAINGWGISLQDAGANSFVASIPRNEKTNMGILHAIYGLGAFASPLVSTQFARQKHWSFHYLTCVGISIINVGLLLYVFRLKPQSHFIPETPRQTDQDQAPQANTSQNLYKQILKHKSVHIMAAFILCYVGVEVTIGGWIVTFLLEERGGGPSAGYVSSGFFGGLTLGRVVLLPINSLIGPERAVYLYSLLAIALEFTIWFVPSLIGNAVAVSLVGLVLGPFYPIAMNVFANLVPRWLLAGSIGWIGAFGPIGAAVLPFMTGALASKYGVLVLQPLLVAMMALQIILWFFVTRCKVSRVD